MQAAVAFVFGILLGTIVLVVTRPRAQGVVAAAPKPSTAGWIALTLGLSAAAALGVGLWLVPRSGNSGPRFLVGSIAFAFAAVVVGAGNMVRGDHRWPTWGGLLAGLAPGLFWIAFAAGEILFSGE